MRISQRTLQLLLVVGLALILATGCAKKTTSGDSGGNKTDDKSPGKTVAGKTNTDGKVAANKTKRADNTKTAPDKTQVEPKTSKTKVARKNSKKKNLTPEQAAVERLKEVGGDIRRNLSGEVSSINLQGSEEVTNDDLALLTHFPYLLNLNVSYTKNISDDGMKHVAKVPRLRELIIAGTGVSDKGIAHLAKMEALDHVCMDGTKVTDGAMKYIKNWQDVTKLHFIGNTGVTDAGLKQLTGLSRLQQLYIGGTKVSKDGINSIKKVFPRIQFAPP